MAGATFMAAGSSAPELATSLVTVFTTKDSTGVGTILGSAVFNLVMIVCVSGYFGVGPRGKAKERCERAAGRSLPDGLFLDWRPLLRDAIFYVFSLFLAVVFALTPVKYKENPAIDGEAGFEWWEGLILALCYIVYVHAMIKNDSLMDWMERRGGMLAHIKEYGRVQAGEAEGGGEVPAIASSAKRQNSFALGRAMAKAEEEEERRHVPTFHGGFRHATQEYVHSASEDDVSIEMTECGSAGENDAEAKAAVIAAREADKNRWRRTLRDGMQGLLAEAREKRDNKEQVQGEEEEEEEEKKALLADAEEEDGGKEEGEKPKPASDSSMRTRSASSVRFEEDSLMESVSTQDRMLMVLSQQMLRMVDGVKTMREDLLPLFKNSEEDFKVDDEEEEEETWSSRILGWLSKPWSLAYELTIPACDRDSFQVWQDSEEDTRYSFEELPQAARARLEDEEDAAEAKYVKGRYSRNKADDAFDRSKRYWVSFFMSVVWIWLTSWGMVEFSNWVGCHLGVGSFMMGLVVLSAGTSIPDTLSSVMVAKDGEGDMAVANAIGSNVFNIFLGIGLPMFFTQLYWSEPYVTGDAAPILASGVMLSIITVIMLVALRSAKWILTPRLSVILMSLFFGYIGLSILFDAQPSTLYDHINL